MDRLSSFATAPALAHAHAPARSSPDRIFATTPPFYHVLRHSNCRCSSQIYAHQTSPASPPTNIDLFSKKWIQKTDAPDGRQNMFGITEIHGARVRPGRPSPPPLSDHLLLQVILDFSCNCCCFVFGLKKKGFA